MAGFNGDSGFDTDRGASPELYGFEGKDVIAQVFAGMGNLRRAGSFGE
jgi:hypothetical protein